MSQTKNSLTRPEPSAPGRLPRQTTIIIAVLLAAAFLVILNETAMNVALTTIMRELRITERWAQWLTTAFMLTVAVVIPITGWFLRRVSTRTAFATAMALFSAGTLVCAVSPAFGVLVVGRVIQASGTAVMLPLLMTTIMVLTPEATRGKVMGNIALVIAVAPAAGPTVSGLILQFLDWRFIFLLVLPLALIILVLGWRRITDVQTDQPTALDVVSIPLAVLGFGGVIYGLSQVGAAGAGWQPVLALAVGTVGVVAFALRQVRLQRADRAMLDLRTYRYPSFALGMVVMAIAMMALFGTVIMLPLIMQKAMHLPALTVGLLMLPGGVLMGVLGPTVGRLYDRFGPRPLILPASVVVAGVLGTLATINPGTSLWLFAACHIAMSAAFAFMFTPLFTGALGALPGRLYAHGSAMVGTVQQLAGAAGTSLFVTVLAVRSASAAKVGFAADAAVLAGARAAFLGAAVLWLGAILAAVFLRRTTRASGGSAQAIAD